MERPKNIYLYIGDPKGFEPVSYRWCYYINSKETVQGVLRHYPLESDILEFSIQPDPTTVDGKQMYQLNKVGDHGTT